ncbi:MAG: hypothetical protein AAFY56_15025 [Pseudomonadota bacterium]
MRVLSLLIGLTWLLVALPAEAYIGPGAGLGTIAVVLGVIASVFMALIAILWYPVKRLVRKRKPKPASATLPRDRETS